MRLSALTLLAALARREALGLSAEEVRELDEDLSRRYRRLARASWTMALHFSLDADPAPQAAEDRRVALLAGAYRKNADLADEMNRLSRRFKVSTLVILRRMHDAGGLTEKQFWDAYHAELRRLSAVLKKEGGGDFYLTTAARVSKRFARAIIANTLEGQTLHRDAFRMLGFSKLETFRELGRGLGVIA